MKINPVQVHEDHSTAPQAVQASVKPREYDIDLPGFGSFVYRAIDLFPFIGQVVSRDIDLIRRWLIPMVEYKDDAICLGQVLLMIEAKPGEEAWWRNVAAYESPDFIGILPGLAAYAGYELDDILDFIANTMVNVLSNCRLPKFAEKMPLWKHRQEWAEIEVISYAVMGASCEIDESAKSRADDYAITCAFKAMGFHKLQSIDSKRNAIRKKGVAK